MRDSFCIIYDTISLKGTKTCLENEYILMFPFYILLYCKNLLILQTKINLIETNCIYIQLYIQLAKYILRSVRWFFSQQLRDEYTMGYICLMMTSALWWYFLMLHYIRVMIFSSWWYSPHDEVRVGKDKIIRETLHP